MSIDHSQTVTLEKRLMKSAGKLKDLAPLVGAAKTVKAYDPDRRKQLLAVSVVQEFKDGAASASEAEFRARASQGYQSGLERLKGELQTAEGVIAEWDAEQAAWDTCRSLLSMAKEQIRNLE